MLVRRVLRRNWLNRPGLGSGVPSTVALVALLALGTWADLGASRAAVFDRGELWRAWTALFAHADLAHLLSNLLLFVPFSIALTRTYSLGFFPVGGFVVGGLTNFLVLGTMPPQATLVGASGVVYWMGAAWVTLACLVDRRERPARRVLKAAGVSLALFLPEAYRPEVSYLAHFLGYVGGVLSAAAYHAAARRRFRAAEVYETIVDLDADQTFAALPEPCRARLAAPRRAKACPDPERPLPTGA